MTKVDGYELEPCPFCGSDKLSIVGNRDDEKPLWYVQCENTDCITTGPWDLGKSGAIEKWNERKAEAK